MRSSGPHALLPALTVMCGYARRWPSLGWWRAFEARVAAPTRTCRRTSGALLHRRPGRSGHTARHRCIVPARSPAHSARAVDADLAMYSVVSSIAASPFRMLQTGISSRCCRACAAVTSRAAIFACCVAKTDRRRLCRSRCPPWPCCSSRRGCSVLLLDSRYVVSDEPAVRAGHRRVRAGVERNLERDGVRARLGAAARHAQPLQLGSPWVSRQRRRDSPRAKPGSQASSTGSARAGLRWRWRAPSSACARSATRAGCCPARRADRRTDAATAPR